MKNSLKTFMTGLAYDIAGGLLYAAGISTFAQSADFAPGGVTGVALILNHLWGLPVGLMALIMNIPLVLISFRVVGRKFLLKSLRSLIVCTIFLDVLFPLLPFYVGSRLLASLFAGVLTGAGMAVMYMHGSSTGGVDLLTMTIKTLRPFLSMGTVTMILDAIVILIGWPVFGSVDAVLYGLICTAVTSYVIDRILCGVGEGKLIMVITSQGEAIAKCIGQKHDRGCTICNAIGGYTGQDRQVLLCACSRIEAYKIRASAYEIDRGCFVMIMSAGEVYGLGFSDPKGTSFVKS